MQSHTLTLTTLSLVYVPEHKAVAPVGRLGMTGVSLLSGTKRLSFDSLFLSALLVFYLFGLGIFFFC